MRTIFTFSFLLIFIACGNADDNTTQGDQDSDQKYRVTNIEFEHSNRYTVADEAGHLAFPDAITLPDNRLLVVYRHGASHVDNSGKIIKRFGSPDGTSWSDAFTAIDTVGIDDRDPSLHLLSDGKIVLTFFKYARLSTASGYITLHHVFLSISEDNGQSFSDPVQISPGDMTPYNAHLDSNNLWVDDNGLPIMVYGCTSPVVEYNNHYYLPIYGGQTLSSPFTSETPRSRIGFLHTDNITGSWQFDLLAEDLRPQEWLQEPHLLILPDGQFLFMARNAVDNSPAALSPMTMLTTSDWENNTSTWNDFNFVGHAPYTLQLSNGVIITAFRRINDAGTQAWTSMIYSLDNGEHWSDLIDIEDCGATECGYPSLVQINENQFLAFLYHRSGTRISASLFTFTTQMAQH